MKQVQQLLFVKKLFTEVGTPTLFRAIALMAKSPNGSAIARDIKLTKLAKKTHTNASCPKGGKRSKIMAGRTSLHTWFAR